MDGVITNTPRRFIHFLAPELQRAAGRGENSAASPLRADGVDVPFFGHHQNCGNLRQFDSEIPVEYPPMNVETIWEEVRPRLKRIPVAQTLPIFLLIVVVLVLGSLYFSSLNGRHWYEGLAVAAYLTLRQLFGRGTTSETKTKDSHHTLGKIKRVLPYFLRVARSMFLLVLVVGVLAVSIWLLVTLLHWFWLHPLFR
jgi:hypothetical protein